MSNRLYSQPSRHHDTLATTGEFIVALLLAVLIISMLCGCTVEPFILTTAKGNKITSLGGTLATRSKAKTKSITTSDGNTLTSSGDNDETVVPRMSMMGDIIGKGLDSAPAVANAFKK